MKITDETARDRAATKQNCADLLKKVEPASTEINVNLLMVYMSSGNYLAIQNTRPNSVARFTQLGFALMVPVAILYTTPKKNAPHLQTVLARHLLFLL
jgi:hypothetical protein